jgi:hypothetical protein
MASEVSHLLELTQRRPQKGRQGCHYNTKEKEVLCKYKDEYKSKKTAVEREALLKGKILVDIFNYWHSLDNTFLTEEVATKRIQVNSVNI